MLVERFYNREVRIVSVDFSQAQVVYPNIAEQIRDIDVGILGEFFFYQKVIMYYSNMVIKDCIDAVNNVGYFDYPSDFECLGAEVSAYS